MTLRSRRGYVAAVLVGAVALVACFWLVRVQRSPVVPTIDVGGLDPEVARAIETARSEVLDRPREAARWGRFGMVLAAHDINLQAMAALAEAERLDGTDLRWPYFQGIALLKENDTERAVAALTRAAARDDGAVAPHLRLAETLLALDRLDEAEARLRRVDALQPDHGRVALGLGRIALRRGDLQASRQHLTQATSSPFAGEAARAELAAVLRRLGDRDGAAGELQRATEAPADVPWPDPLLDQLDELQTGLAASLARGERLVLEGRTREGLVLLQEIARTYPASDRPHLFLGRAHLRLGDPAAAERDLLEAIRRGPENVEAHYLLGSALYFQRRYDAAADEFRKATAIQPEHALAHYNLAQCLVVLGDEAGALEELRAAIRFRPNLVAAHRDLGELLLRRGKHCEAVIHLRNVLALAPADEAARRLLRQAQPLRVDTAPYK